MLAQKVECQQQQQRQKESILKKLKKLIPGSSTELSAIQREDDTITNEPSEMAEALRKHWQNVFKRKWMDRGILEEWFKELQTASNDVDAQTTPLRTGSHGHDGIKKVWPNHNPTCVRAPGHERRRGLSHSALLKRLYQGGGHPR